MGNISIDGNGGRFEVVHRKQVSFAPSAVKITAFVLGLLLFIAAIVMTCLHVNAMGTHITYGVGATLIISTIIWHTIDYIRST